jgi:hypothetical protein
LVVAWIFQIDGTFGISPSKKVLLAGGALSKNIVWVVAGAVSVEAGARFEGVILGATGITVKTGATGKGRLLAKTLVALQKATVTSP